MKTNLSRVGLAAAGLAFVVAGCSDPTIAPPPTFDDFAPEAPSFSSHEADVALPNVIDLTEVDNAHEVTNGVWVEQSIFDGSTGTGVFESFVRLNSNATSVKGFNTSGRPLKNDEMSSANFTRDLLLSSVPLQPKTGDDKAIYREFRADINQTAGGTFLSLDAIQVFISKTPGANPDLPISGASPFGTCSALVWEMPEENWIALNYILAPGSGNGDMRLLIPDQLFTAAQAGCGAEGPWYVYLYSEFGGEGGIWGQDNGFEEWSVRKAVGVAQAFKTANGTFDRTWNWTLDKAVDVDAWDLFVGDDATSGYEVTVDASSTNSNYQVSGNAFLINAGATGLRVGTRTDQVGYVDEFNLDGPMTVVATPTLTCDTSVLGNPGGNTLPAGSTLSCTYSYTFPNPPAAPPAGKVWANRVTFNTGQGSNAVAYSYTAEFAFLVNNTFGNNITVEDNFDGEGYADLFSRNAETQSLPYTWSYTRNFECADAEDGGDFGNTARIKGTTITSSASVTVNCYELDIEKDADTSFRWDWSIDKAEDADRTELFLNYGELGTLDYTVTASATDVEHRVFGNITVTNDAPIDAVLNSITDLITRSGAADINGAVSCLVGEEGEEVEAVFPYTLEAGEALSCTYSANLPNRDARLNTATAEQQNFSYAFDPEEGESGEVTSEASGTTDYDATANVEFRIGDDNCVEVFDDKTDTGNPVSLGYACAQADDDNPAGAVLLDANGDAEFTYSLTVGVDAGADIELECGDTTLTNIASLMDETADWTVEVSVYCPEPDDETAWAANGSTPLQLAYNPGGGGNWATYVAYGGVQKVTTVFAGQTIDVGTATFSAPVAGMVTITVNLTGGWTFASGGIIAVQDYASAPSGNPAPGQFDHKAPASGTSVSIMVPVNNFYGVHLVVMN